MAALNMRLLGSKHSSLEASITGGTLGRGVRVNVGKISKDKVVGNIAGVT